MNRHRDPRMVSLWHRLGQALFYRYWRRWRLVVFDYGPHLCAHANRGTWTGRLFDRLWSRYPLYFIRWRGISEAIDPGGQLLDLDALRVLQRRYRHGAGETSEVEGRTEA